MESAQSKILKACLTAAFCGSFENSKNSQA